MSNRQRKTARVVYRFDDGTTEAIPEAEIIRQRREMAAKMLQAPSLKLQRLARKLLDEIDMLAAAGAGKERADARRRAAQIGQPRDAFDITDVSDRRARDEAIRKSIAATADLAERFNLSPRRIRQIKASK